MARAGRYRHRVEFLEPTAVLEASGGERTDYVLAFRQWAGVEPVRANEAMRSNQPLEKVDIKIVGRWSRNIARVSTAWRIRHAGALYDITGIVNPRSANTEFEIMAASGVVS